MTQPDENEKRAILSQILESQGFLESKRHRELLQYLVEKAATSESLKETEIARDVFGKDASFDPGTDPLIRSYVSNLRKKLDHYYLTTEDEYRYRLEIPKGHYLVKYSILERPKKPRRIRERLAGLYPIVIFLLLIIIGVLVFREFESRPAVPTSNPTVEANPLWSEFIQTNGRPTLVVLGDFFFMRERGNSDVYLRKGRINNLDEYLEFINANPSFFRQYTRNSFTFLRPSAPWGLMNLLQVLRSSPNGVSLKLASQFTFDDFKANNVVFVGSFKTLHLLRNFLHIFKLDYSTIPPSSFRIQDGIGDSLHVFQPERLSAGNVEKDYAIIAKGQGPDGSTIMMLLGFSESGVIQSTQAAIDPLLLKTIAEQYPASTSINPSSLTLVIAAEGMTQSLFTTEVKYMAGVGPPTLPSRSGSKDSVESH